MRILFKLGLLFILTASCRPPADAKPAVIIGRLDIIPRAAAWCSCKLSRWDGGGPEGTLLISSFAPAPGLRIAWMNLDGSVVELPQKKSCTFMSPGDSGVLEQCAFFKSGYVVSTQLFITSRNPGGYITKGSMRVTKSGVRSVIEVEGSCGCSA